MKNWRDMSWMVVRSYLSRFALSFIGKITGPIGWIATQALPIFLDKLAKPGWQWVTRKIQKKSNVKKGKEKAKDVRDVPSDNVDDIYDNLKR